MNALEQPKEAIPVARDARMEIGLVAAGSVTMALGLLTLLGWISGWLRLASFGADRIPMAPSTAVLFLLFGAAVVGRARTPLSRLAQWGGVAMVSFGTLVAVLLIGLASLKMQWAGEHLGLHISGTVAGAPIGHMSVVTAFCFLLAGVSFLVSLSPSVIGLWRTSLALLSTGVLLGSGLVFLLAYAFGTPLLYNGQFIPPALNTILAFIMLALALMALASRSTGLLHGLPGATSQPVFSAVLIFFLLTMGIVAGGYAHYRNIERKFRTEATQQLSAIAELKIDELVQWRRERFADAQTFIRNPVVSQLVRRCLAPAPDVEARRQLRVSFANYRESYRYDEVFLLDAQGQVRLSDSEAPVTVAAAIAARLPEALGSAQPLFQDFYRHEKSQQIRLALLIPIRDETPGAPPLAVLVLHINPELYLYPLIQRWPLISSSAETLLVSRDGNEALYLNDLRHQTNAALVLRVPLTYIDKPSVKAILGETGFVSGRDYRGVPVIANAAAVPGSPWFLIAKIDRDEVYAPLHTQLWQMIAFIVVLIFGAGAGVSVVWRQQSLRFYRERAEAAETLRESEERLRRAILHAPFPLLLHTDDGEILMISEPLTEITGFSHADIPTLAAWTERAHGPQELLVQTDIDRLYGLTGKNGGGEQEIHTRYGTKRTWEFTSAQLGKLPDGRRLVLSMAIDLTERKLAEAEKEKLTTQLIQAQKMESVGRLAGGVAHDFNNLLTIINGYSDLLLDRLRAPDPLRSHVELIRKAGERASSLTKQLLAYSRRQVIAPKKLDLNRSISDALPMLRRLIGEDITVTSHLDAASGAVMADPGQLNQVIMNLFVNARDAMPEGGELQIGTANVELDEEAAAAIDPGATPGRYVLMTVTDNGCGINDANRQRIFEPFFTTKEVGKGTGLGLSTVYGIIRQSNGWITVKSEVGVGTSFMIYLPRMDASLPPEAKSINAPSEKGTETILLVEDQEAVRSFAKAVLQHNGYLVIEASSGEEAAALAKNYQGQIHLLLTDVILPGMNGKDLSEMVKGLLPHLAVLFISGYSADTITSRGALNPGVAFLQKPFSPDDLAAKVHEVLVDGLVPSRETRVSRQLAIRPKSTGR